MHAFIVSKKSPAERFLTTIIDAVPGMIAYWDVDLRCRFANKRYLEWFGKAPEALIGSSMAALMGERLFELNLPYIQGALRGEKQDFERVLTRADGSVGYTWANYIPDLDEVGSVCGFFVLVTDVTPMKRAEAQLRASEARYRMLAEHGTDMVFQLDRDGVRRYVSPASREILGYEPDELIGIRSVDQAHPEDARRLELVLQSLLSGQAKRGAIVSRIRRRDGRWIWVEADFRVLNDPQTGEPSGIVGALRDISDRKAIEDQLQEANRQLQALAGQDGLTGLANRRIFDETLFREWSSAKRSGSGLAIVMIDVDWFKPFNDRYGHPAGDECLRQVSAAIGTTIHRPRDLVARFGGEEFVVILPETDESGAAVIADRMRRAVASLAITHKDSPNGFVTISAGVASFSCAIDAPGQLVVLADRALYRAKNKGRNQIASGSDSIAPAIGEAQDAA